MIELNRSTAIAAGAGLVAILASVAAYQSHVQSKYEAEAEILHRKADAAEAIKLDALAQKEGLTKRAEELERDARRYRDAYLAAKAKIPPPPGPPPPPSELAPALEAAGYAPGVVVSDTATASIFTQHDAGLAWLTARRSERTDELQAALDACDKLQTQQAETITAKNLELNTTNKALTAAMDEARLRAGQAEALTKSLKAEKGKRWQRVVAFGAGVLLGAYARGH